jgi:hypothetical protein
MGKKTPPEDLVIPPQDSRICGTICVCQMTAVLSSVALVYLTVAIYLPAMRAFRYVKCDIMHQFIWTYVNNESIREIDRKIDNLSAFQFWRIRNTSDVHDNTFRPER